VATLQIRRGVGNVTIPVGSRGQNQLECVKIAYSARLKDAENSTTAFDFLDSAHITISTVQPQPNTRSAPAGSISWTCRPPSLDVFVATGDVTIEACARRQPEVTNILNDVTPQ
jgi:hypothetical protein